MIIDTRQVDQEQASTNFLGFAHGHAHDRRETGPELSSKGIVKSTFACPRIAHKYHRGDTLKVHCHFLSDWPLVCQGEGREQRKKRKRALPVFRLRPYSPSPNVHCLKKFWVVTMTRTPPPPSLLPCKGSTSRQFRRSTDISIRGEDLAWSNSPRK